MAQFVRVIVAAVAGLAAGVGTGFAGLSAATFIAPMLIAYLKVDSFSAIGIALASDVLASAASALTYAKNKNIDLRRGRTLMVTVLLFAVAGTLVANHFTSFSLGENFMGYWLILASLAMGVKLLLFPAKNREKEKGILPFPDNAVAVVTGIYIGFICGFQGTGGGLMMLFVLNVLLGFEFKKAVGTSVFIMSMTAFIGAASHFMIRGLPDTDLLILCILFTLIGAEGAAYIANRVPAMLLKRITGGLMTVSGIAMLLTKIL